MDQETFLKLKEIYDEYSLGDLNVKDIEGLEINNKLIAKYINSYRFALIIQKVTDIGNDETLAAQINLCSMIISELMTGLEKKRKEYYNKKEKEKKSKEEKEE